MTPTANLTDPQYRLVTVLEAWARDRPGEPPTNRAIAELCGWRSSSKVGKVLIELEGRGVLTRVLEYDGRQVRRTSITLNEPPRPVSEPAPAQTQVAPLEHWITGVRSRVMELLTAVSAEGAAVDPERMRRVAGQVQTELAGERHGNASSLLISIVEAVSVGYDLSVIETAITQAGEGRCPRCRADIRKALWNLYPDPRGWIQLRRRTERSTELVGAR
jgi:hypothetical protein